MKMFVVLFSILTAIDLLLIIFAAIIEHDHSSIELCFNGCSLPRNSRGAAYLSIKLIYDYLTP